LKYVLGSVERSNITEGQIGFPLYLDILVMNTETCEPLSGVIVDFWHVNLFMISIDRRRMQRDFTRGLGHWLRVVDKEAGEL
jgi:hypothetical protein